MDVIGSRSQAGVLLCRLATRSNGYKSSNIFFKNSILDTTDVLMNYFLLLTATQQEAEALHEGFIMEFYLILREEAFLIRFLYFLPEHDLIRIRLEDFICGLLDLKISELNLFFSYLEPSIFRYVAFDELKTRFLI